MIKHQPVVWPGKPFPLGASWDGHGVNFALFSEQAERVELCLFDARGRREIERITLPERTDMVWHGYLPGAAVGLLYGYRVHGQYRPQLGQRFNPNKLLLDPYAKATIGKLHASDADHAYKLGAEREDLSFDWRDNGAAMPKCQVTGAPFDWEDDRAPDTPWSETVIYEVHVKGFTALHPAIPGPLRGTYAGLACAPAIAHLQRLGVTAVDLLPVHCFLDERTLVKSGMRNYWGYNSIGFFAPARRYAASSDAPGEFKAMVKALHRAGIEVILDVVYNHTAEGNHLGPTVCFRGIDNLAYYRLKPGNPRFYMDYTGCGNTLNTMHPQVLQLIMDSLRYWVQEMHVDGFRFDLAATLAREAHEFDRHGAFLDIIHQDPVLSRVKLIAEPWDVGEGGYQVGNFPVGWTEWNGKYRDAVRAYWKGEGGLIGDLAYRLTGSSDLYAHNGRRPCASINFVTAHDGFVLQDLVSYQRKHNEANGEDNRDGADNNQSWNCGVEGPTDDAEILALRARQKRNLLATLLLSQGVPMIVAGDEMGHTQHGNNNAYCQDNAISWIDWELSQTDLDLLAFVRQLIRFRREHPAFRRRSYFHVHSPRDSEKNILWFDPDGLEMGNDEWNQGFARCLGMYLLGDAIGETDTRGSPVADDDFMLLINAHHEEIPFVLPSFQAHVRWHIALDTSQPAGAIGGRRFAGGDIFPLQGRSLALLQQPGKGAARFAADFAASASSAAAPSTAV
ncbi:MAG: glycogen debranching protein GlgX [Sterolibacteriaceae bacterium]|uniref:Glycogen debranching protein GlgX n=1 Tax=Candidatus Methylophosphatis roskildensis TaxID=2899263 RepID=A0A9D7HKQ0_9PROT|nr:glycogen debranching protein GlgX [Candidatus Methylophosphatis roskildensis]